MPKKNQKPHKNHSSITKIIDIKDKLLIVVFYEQNSYFFI
jgi:hypothetical protein